MEPSTGATAAVGTLYEDPFLNLTFFGTSQDRPLDFGRRTARHGLRRQSLPQTAEPAHRLDTALKGVDSWNPFLGPKYAKGTPCSKMVGVAYRFYLPRAHRIKSYIKIHLLSDSEGPIVKSYKISKTEI